MTLQTGSPWISLTADYLIADSALPEQLLNDVNLWLDQARLMLYPAMLEACLDLGEGEDMEALKRGLESLDRLLGMAQGCASQAHRQLLRQQLAAGRE